VPETLPPPGTGRQLDRRALLDDRGKALPGIAVFEPESP